MWQVVSVAAKFAKLMVMVRFGVNFMVYGYVTIATSAMNGRSY